MPGLRIGYSLSSRSVAAILKERQPPWSVNTVAQRAAEAAIADQRHARRCLAYVGRERARMTKQLAALAGVTVIPSSANFVFAELPPSCGAGLITAALRRRGMLIRDCSSVEGCGPRSIRMAVRNQGETIDCWRPWRRYSSDSMSRQHSKTGGVRYRVRGNTWSLILRRGIGSSLRRRAEGDRSGAIDPQSPSPANPVMPGGRSVGEWSDPARYLGRLARSVRAAMPVVGLMTAVPMTQLVVDREQSGSLLLECFCTVGVTNAVRAGEPVRSRLERTQDRDQAGTINIILVTNATLTTPALIGAVQVATESKTATLIKHKVPSAYEEPPWRQGPVLMRWCLPAAWQAIISCSTAGRIPRWER